MKKRSWLKWQHLVFEGERRWPWFKTVSYFEVVGQFKKNTKNNLIWGRKIEGVAPTFWISAELSYWLCQE